MLLRIEAESIDIPLLVINTLTNKVLFVNSGACKMGYSGSIGKDVSLLGIEERYDKKVTVLDNGISVIFLEQKYCHRFMANFSYHMKAPLISVINMVTLLSDTDLDKEQKKYIETLNEAGYSFLFLINDILDYSSLELGKIKLNEKIFYFEKCIENAHSVVFSNAAEKGIHMTYSIEKELPDFFLGDPDRIKQILVNLFYNSIKLSQREKNIHTNIGISVELDKIITIFCSVKNQESTTSIQNLELFSGYTDDFNPDGMGLGLTICKDLVKIMNGEIWVKDHFDNSTSVHFTLKLKTLTEKVSLGNIDITVFENKRVLIIESDPVNRINICNKFMKWKMHPIPCVNINEANLFITNELLFFDAIMICTSLPRNECINFAKKIKSTNFTLPIIAMDENNDDSDFFKNFFDYFLIKPVKEEKLLISCYEIFIKKSHISKNNIKKNHSENKIIDIKILIDDDVHLNKILLKTLLNKLGFYNIKTVNDGQQAMDAIKKDSYDMCLIDIKTPKLSGYDIISEIKKGKDKPYFVAITTQVHDNGEYYKSRGFDDFLVKPIDSTGIGRIISSFMKRNK